MAKLIRNRLKRRIAVAGQETPGDRAARTAVRFVTDHRYYEQILNALRAGTPNTRIAEHGIARGWFDLNQKTVVSYLQYFRKMHPNLCKPQIRNEEDASHSEREFGFDSLFDGNSLIVDPEVELLRLIKLQQARLGIGFRNERELNMLLHTNRREVEELRNLIVDLAKLRGLITNGVNVSVVGYSEGVKADLQSVKQDEQQRSVIATLVQDLVGVTNA